MIDTDHLETLGDVTLRDVVPVATDLFLGIAGVSSSHRQSRFDYSYLTHYYPVSDCNVAVPYVPIQFPV
ncbi:hypothetical protein DPMN_153795 [Dreissena polymorpha]|uniref:Uncharacterized protein n=1 Tax=Dreissena polymorpha TaxID=45954 RepID=A0A9D4J553_DREPO|nr:hypothetical protein DPMN_153795 [Dreissena polymorpha]